MASVGAAQYIDTMLNLHPPKTRTLRIPPRASRFDVTQFLRVPGQCLVCHRWQWSDICGSCEHAFAPAVLRCQRCALRLNTDRQECMVCEDYPPEFERAVTAVDYTAPWRGLISDLKFKQHTALAEPLAALLSQQIKAAPHQARPHWIIATPLSAQRLRERGFNQSGLLAQALSKRLGIPMLPQALRRIKDTPRMMSLQADERRQHICDAFEITPEHRRALAGRRVAVVDDVLTSGATLNEISRTLREGGVRSITAWVVARTPAPNDHKAVDRVGP